jgi:hypothetical protein
VWTLINKGKRVGKEDLAQWVSLAFKKTLILTNIYKGFKAIAIWVTEFNCNGRKM